MRPVDRLDRELSRFSVSDHGNFGDGVREGLMLAAEVLDVEMYHILLEMQNEAMANEVSEDTKAVALGIRKAIKILTGELSVS